MDKKTSTILAVGALAAIGYLVWKSQGEKKGLLAPGSIGQVGLDMAPGDIVAFCRSDKGVSRNPTTVTLPDGTRKRAWVCCGGALSLTRPSMNCQGGNL